MNQGKRDLIETERLIIRPFLLEDIEGFFEMCSDPDVIRYTYEKPLRDLDHAKEILQKVIDGNQKSYGRWSVVEKATQACIGFSGWKWLKEFEASDLGYRLIKSKWRQGFGFECAKAMLEFGPTRWDLGKKIALVDQDNPGSVRIVEKLGFKYEKDINLPEVPGPTRYYLFPESS